MCLIRIWLIHHHMRAIFTGENGRGGTVACSRTIIESAITPSPNYLVIREPIGHFLDWSG